MELKIDKYNIKGLDNGAPGSHCRREYNRDYGATTLSIMTFSLRALDTESWYAKCGLCCVSLIALFMLIIIMLSVVMLSVVMLSVVMLSVIIQTVVVPGL
jgi:hypothetical protein